MELKLTCHVVSYKMELYVELFMERTCSWRQTFSR